MASPSASNKDPYGHKKYVGKIPEFLTKTYDLVWYCDQEHNDIVSWTTNGDAFIVKDPKRLGSNILSKYFDSNKPASFNRQLNFYCFDKNTNFSDVRSNQVTYSHRFFKRDEPDLLPQIKRKTSPEEKFTKEVSNMKTKLKDLGEKWRSNMDTLKEKLEVLASSTNARLDDIERSVFGPSTDKPILERCSSSISAGGDSFCDKIDTLFRNNAKLDRVSSCDSITTFPTIILKNEREISLEILMSIRTADIHGMDTHISENDLPDKPDKTRTEDGTSDGFFTCMQSETTNRETFCGKVTVSEFLKQRRERLTESSNLSDDLPDKPIKTGRDTTGEIFFSYMESGEWLPQNKNEMGERQSSIMSILSGLSDLSTETQTLFRQASDVLDQMLFIPKPSNSRCTSKMKSGDLEEKTDSRSMQLGLYRKASGLSMGNSNLSDDMMLSNLESSNSRCTSDEWDVNLEHIDEKLDVTSLIPEMQRDTTDDELPPQDKNKKRKRQSSMSTSIMQCVKKLRGLSESSILMPPNLEINPAA